MRKRVMRKRATAYLICIVIVFTMIPTASVKAEENKELNIYAMYLGEDQTKGNSVLLESKGHFLLIDIGRSVHMPSIINQLKSLGANSVDIMFSHLHIDHVGALDTDHITDGLSQLTDAGIAVDTMYLPAQSLSSWSRVYPSRFAQLQQFMRQQGKGRIVYLRKDDTLTLGDVEGKVIGPLTSAQIYPGKYTEYPVEVDRYTVYENNCSLAVIFTCGETRFFTAGDCYADEAESLVKEYGDDLRSDIMQLCHHGVGGGNSENLIKAVHPAYSFASNTGMDTLSDVTGRWKFYYSEQRATKYGMCYLTGNEKKTLIYHIVNNEITLYQGQSVSEGKKMTGWQYLYGADGINRDHDMYYLDDNCNPVTGINQIGKHMYYFSNGGKMEYGDYSDDGEYLGWKTDKNGKRYYKLSSNNKYAFMCQGMQVIDDKYYYFDDSGYMIEGNEDEFVTIKKIDSDYYALGPDGEITINEWEVVDDAYYYFDRQGKMVRDCQYMEDGEYYIFNKDGQMLFGKNGTEIIRWKSNDYAVRKDGTLVTGGCKTLKGDKYYFGKKGVIQKNKIIKIGKKKYYFGKNGKMVRGSSFKYNGKQYISNEKGEISSVSK